MSFSIFRQLNEASNRDRVALKADGVALTYDMLNVWSDCLAMQMGGSLEGKSIGLLAPSSLEFVAGMIAIWKVGGRAVPLQPAHPVSELAYIVENAEIETVLVHRREQASAQLLNAKVAFRLIEIPDEILDGILDELPRSVSLQAQQPAIRKHNIEGDALMIYTSGTTKRPKGVPVSHAGLEAQIQSLLQAWHWSNEDRTINILPLHHVHGLVNILCCALAAGAQCEMVAKFEASMVWRRICEGEINIFMAVPTVYARLIEHWEAQKQDVRETWSVQAQKMRLMVSGSAALPQSLFEKWEAVTGHRLVERYGMTEIGMALSNPYEGPRVPGRVGVPLPRVEVRLVSESGEVIAKPNLPGEIQVRGAAVFKEYWKMPEATLAAFDAEGWFRTGDVGERDASGVFKILGRLSQDIIKSGGYKISALEIESELLENPLVREVAVVGVEDAKWGERVAAAYASDTLSDSDCDHFLKKRLAHYKVPTLWCRVESLPRNAMGKTLKAEVRKLFSKR